MAEPKKCAHPSCECMVTPGGPHGKYCSNYCEASRDKTDLRCDCGHTPCRT